MVAHKLLRVTLAAGDEIMGKCIWDTACCLRAAAEPLPCMALRATCSGVKIKIANKRQRRHTSSYGVPVISDLLLEVLTKRILARRTVW